MNINSTIRNAISKNNNTSKILNMALMTLSEKVLDGCLVMDDELEYTLRVLTHNVSMRWKWILRRLHIRCPECGNLLNNKNTDCSRFECFTCGEILMVKSKTLRQICVSCISFKDTCQGPMSNEFEEPIVTKLPLIYRKSSHGS